MPAQPQKTPIVQKPSPIVADQLIVETEDSNTGLFDRMLEYGHRHNDQVKYPAHVLLKQGPNAYGVYQRVWGTVPVYEDTYNATVNQAEESNSHPVFERAYRVLRADYLITGPATKGVAFTGLIAVKLTAGGTGYTKDFAVTFTGGAGSGATALAIVDGRGVIVRVELLNPGTGFTSAPTVVFSAGDGTGATGTTAIQPAAAVLVSEKHVKLPDGDPYSSLFDRVVKTYETLPGPILTSQSRSGEVRGRIVDTISQTGVDGALDAQSGTGIIASSTEQLDSVKERRTTKKFNGGNLPPNEVWYDYQHADIPRRIFSLNPTLICNGSSQGVTVSWNPVSKPGGSFVRKHRTTVSYSSTAPGDTALNIFTRADLDYDGRVVNQHYHGVLNDAISYNQIFTLDDCSWYEAFSFPASDPSASNFDGQWWLVSRQTTPFGTTDWRTVTVEFYEE